MTTIGKARPWLGVLFFLGLSLPGEAVEDGREILIALQQPVLQLAATGLARTGLPDVDAILGQHPGNQTSYALADAVSRHPDFKNVLLVRLSNEDEKSDFVRKISRLSSVKWAQGNHLLRSHLTPDDPYFGDQWGLQHIGAPAAWDVNQGSGDIPIAIIDTGCELTHPDLMASLWTNPGEIGGNNIDDDNNGYVDDIHGWDFVDAPSFPSSGDYLVRDNDPSDENGHGTAIAGICGAQLNNGLGVAGLAPGCPIMVLRAGNMDGYLQEDDVASAILYALDNGAQIVNMSFGDTQASPMLEDVIAYTAQAGLILVAASGNYGNATMVYPAAYGAVLNVGASNQNGQRAWFSSYGVSLDLLAPGVGIYSTLREGSYGTLMGGNGSSYAAAFASASAGLVLSKHPDWDANMVISTLKSSCDDYPPSGWDAQSGQGNLRVDRALEIPEGLIVQITNPTMGQGFSNVDTLVIAGTAAGVYIEDFLLYAGQGENPTSWDTLHWVRGAQIVDDTLGYWDISEPTDTAYTVRLAVSDIFGNTADDRVVVYFDPTEPEISNIEIFPILDGERPSYLLTFHTDDQTTGKVLLHELGDPLIRWTSITLNYETTDHVVLMGRDLAAGDYQYYVWVENSAGLIDSTAILDTLNLQVLSMATNNFVELPSPGIPPGLFYEEATDLDNDEFPEIWADTLDGIGAISDLRVWEATPSWEFSDLGLDFGQEIPKSIGDSDENGKAELLTLYGGVTKIYEAPASNSLPLPGNVIWSDSGNVWGAKLLDLHPNDGQGEVLLFSDGAYQLWAHQTDNPNLIFMQSLPNPFDPSASFLPPYCRMSDYDGDGKTDLLFGDYDGHLYIYEEQPNGEFEVSWSDSTPLLDTGEFLTDGDYDGDDQIEFAALAHTQTVLAGEHLADTRYWGLYVYKSSGDDAYTGLDTLYFFGAESPSSFPSGITSGDVYGDAKAEMLVCVYPDFYAVGWDPSGGRFIPLWYYPQCRSNKAVIADFNRNGISEFLLNDGSETHTFEAVGSWSNWPPPPLGFEAIALADRVSLAWLPVTGADAYNIYRAEGSESLLFFLEVPENQRAYIDFEVSLDSAYTYAVSTVDLTAPTPEGPTTVPLTAIPNLPPYVIGDTAGFVLPNYVTVNFSEPMGPSILDVNNYWVAETGAPPQSAVSDLGGRRAVLTCAPPFEHITYRLVINELYDLQGSALSTLYDTLYFEVAPQIVTLPYLISAAAANGLTTVTLLFSQPMDHEDLTNVANYSITVDPASPVNAPQIIVITDAEVDSTIASSAVDLLVSPNTPLGAFGRIYRVTATNIFNEFGQEVDPNLNSATLNFAARTLGDAFVFPNPYSSKLSLPYVIFANLTEEAEIRILSLSGILVKKIMVADNLAGGVSWDLRNERGEPVGSGVYLYYIKNGDETKWGKLAVVR